MHCFQDRYQIDTMRKSSTYILKNDLIVIKLNKNDINNNDNIKHRKLNNRFFISFQGNPIRQVNLCLGHKVLFL